MFRKTLKYIPLFIVGFLVLTPAVHAAGIGDYVGHIGFYCPPETEAITPDGTYTFANGDCHFFIDGAQGGSPPGIVLVYKLYKGTVGAAVEVFGGADSESYGVKDYVQATSYWGTAEDDDYFAAMWNYSQCPTLGTYLESGGEMPTFGMGFPCSMVLGTIPFTFESEGGEPPAGLTIITLPPGFLAGVTGIIGQLFTDLSGYIILLVGVAAGIYVIRKVIDLAFWYKDEHEYSELVADYETYQKETENPEQFGTWLMDEKKMSEEEATEARDRYWEETAEAQDKNRE